MMRFLRHKQFLVFLLLILFSLPAILPLLQPGFFITDDGEWMIIRLSAFYAALHDGQFPVRFLPRLNMEYGYPVATFLYPGYLYAAVPFVVLKFGFVNAIKIILGISLMGSTIFMYLWLSRLFSKGGSFVGALVSLYLPYHLYDVYGRGSVGEVFALLWIPGILWMMERKSIVFTSIGICLLLISHNSLALLFLPLLFLYGILRKVFRLRRLVMSFLLGGGLAAFFILPALIELPLTRFSKTVISEPTKYFADLPMIGISSLIIVILAVSVILRQKKTQQQRLAAFFVALSLSSMLFSSPVSSIIWQNGSASFIQFPFRLLSYLVPSLAFLSAYILSFVAGKQRFIVAIIILGIVAFSAVPYLIPKDRFDKGDAYYATNMASTTVHDEYLPLWVKEPPINRPEEKIVVKEVKGAVSDIVTNNKAISFTITGKKESLVQVNTIYWPGWNILVDGKEVEILYTNPQGVMQFLAPKGNHDVLVRFDETPIRIVSEMISVASLLALIVLTRLSKRTNPTYAKPKKKK